LRAFGLKVAFVELQVVFECFPPVRLQHADAGGGFLDAGDRIGTQRDFAGAWRGVGEYVGYALGKSLAGSTDKADSWLPSRVDLASSGAGSSGGVMIRSEPFMCITGCSSQYFLNSCSYFLHPSPDSTVIVILRRIFDLFSCDFGGETVIVVLGRENTISREQKASSFQPPIAVHHDVANFHGVVVKDHVIDFAEFLAVSIANGSATNILDVVRHRLRFKSAVVSHECLPLLIDLQTQESVERAAKSIRQDS
jgi:hypothetical protein